MGIVRRLKTGWTLAMDSLTVLRAEPSLAVFPLLAGIAGAIYVGLLLGGAALLTGPEPGVLVYAGLFVVYRNHRPSASGLDPRVKAVSLFLTCSVRLMYRSTVRLLISPVVPT